MGLESIRLDRTAKMLVEINARVLPTENVCILTDTNKLIIAEALARASYALGAETVVCIMTPRQMHGNDPPEVAAGAMKAAQVLILPTTYAISHTAAAKAAREAGARSLVLRGITEDTFLNGAITADSEELYAVTNRVSDRLDAASEIHMTTSLGSDIRMSKAGRRVTRSAGLLRGEVRSTSLPAGESATCPAESTTEGTLVVDHAIDNYGPLTEPGRLTVTKGRIVRIEGGKEAKWLEEIIRNNKNADNIAEFAMGTNPCSRMLR